MIRVLRLGLVAAVAAVALAACSAEPTPGWTYAPVSIPPAGSPGTGASPGPASPGPPTTAPSAGETVIDLTAKNVSFEQTSLSAPANTAFTIHFTNDDAGIPHNVEIRRGSAGGESVFKGDIITGVASTDYRVPPLPAGTYTVICDVHPTQMIARLTVT